MNKNIKIVVMTGMSVLLSMHMQAMQEQQQKVTEQSVLTSPAARQNFYRELIQQAIAENNIAQIQALLDRALQRGFDINSGDTMGRTLLHNAAISGNSSAVKVLLKSRANPNSKNYIGSTPLHHAVMSSLIEPEIVQALIQARADVNASNSYGSSPLSLAIASNRVPAVKMLLAAPGIDFNRKKISTILHELKQKKPAQKFQNMIKLLDSYYTTLAGLSVNALVKNIDRYHDKLHLLPQELQEEVNRRLAQ